MHTNAYIDFGCLGHLIALPQRHLKQASVTSRYLRQKEQNFCPVYQPTRNPPDVFLGEGYGLIQSVRSRPDMDFGRFITGLDLSVVTSLDAPWWDLSGWCAVPQAEEYVSTSVSHDEALPPFDYLDFNALAERLSELLGTSSSKTPKTFDYVLSIDGSVTEADKNLSTAKVHRVEGGFMVRNITGVKAYVSLKYGRCSLAYLQPPQTDDGQNGRTRIRRNNAYVFNGLIFYLVLTIVRS